MLGPHIASSSDIYFLGFWVAVIASNLTEKSGAKNNIYAIAIFLMLCGLLNSGAV